MKPNRSIWRGIAIFLVLAFAVAPMLRAAGPPVTRTRPGELIVQYRADAAPLVETKGDSPAERLAFRPAGELGAKGRPGSLRKLAERFGLREGRPLSARTGAKAGGRAGVASAAPGNAWLLRFDSGANVEELVEAYRADPHVLHAEPNHEGSLFFVPSDPLYAQTSADLGLIGIEAAWDVRAGADPSVVVAVIDSGVDATHPDLASALDLTRSFNVTDNTDQIFDDLDHGTRVAGIIGAVGGNGEGIAGVAFGSTLVSLDVADPLGVVTVADVISAIDLAVAGGADVINLSLGFRGFSPTLEATCQAATDAGALLVASAGNEGQGDVPVYPASLRSVVGVGALAEDGLARASWSNFNGLDGSLVELAAPGTTVFSTISGAQYNGTFGSGTSFAAPMVAGTAALLMAHQPAQSAGAVRNHLRATAESPEAWSGHGRLNAAAALGAPMTPAIRVQEVLIDDDPAIHSGNDNDGRLDHGETAHLTLGLVNGGGDAFNVSGTIETPSTDVLVPESQAVWGDLSFNENDLPYLTMPQTATFENIQFTSADPVSGTVDFILDLTGNDGGWTETLSFAIETKNRFTAPTIIATDTVWGTETTYSIEGHTVVMPTATLTIQPGTTVELDRFAGLEIRGGIHAVGTEEEKITFSAEGVSGWFSEEARLPIGGGPPIAVSIADADNDGDNDIVTAARCIFLYRWNGNGFDEQEKILVLKGQEPVDHFSAFAFDDVNDDGFKDIVVIISIESFVAVLPGSASGFDPQSTIIIHYRNGVLLQDIIVNDINNDGRNEIIVSREGVGGDHFGDIVIHRWNGSSFPITDTLFPIPGSFNQSLYVGDADNDGNKDIITVNISNGLTIFRSNADGFEEETVIGGGAYKILVVDVNNDGQNELATLDGAVTIREWRDSEFVTIHNVGVGGRARDMSFTDIDGDGDGDFVVARSRENDVGIVRWNGFGFDPMIRWPVGEDPQSVYVGDANNDGFNDIVTGNTDSSDLSLVLWDPDLHFLNEEGAFKILNTASEAMFRYCDLTLLSLLDQSSIGSYADCFFERSGGEYSLYSTGGTNPIERCRVIDNPGGDGIRAGSKALISCIAERNAGVGLRAGTFIDCASFDNGGDGMVGDTARGSHAERNQGTGISVQGDATDCIVRLNQSSGLAAQGDVTGCLAQSNTGWGIVAGQYGPSVTNFIGNVFDSTSALNTKGIGAVDLSNCIASLNAEVGIEGAGTAAGCLAEGNGGAGFAGVGLTDCTLVHNGQGLLLAGTALRCTVAENLGHGVRGGRIVSSVVLHNSIRGIQLSDAVENTWVLGNGEVGVAGRSGPPYTTIVNSAIIDNARRGVISSGTMSGSVIHGNDPEGGLDYLETRPSTELLQVDLSGNYWGPVTTPLMDANPWGTFFDIPTIRDFVDDTLLTEAKYDGHLASAADAGPDETAPAFLLSVAVGTLGPGDPVNVGINPFILTFSEPMDTSVLLPFSVTFGLEPPYSEHVVEPAPGWIDALTWRGEFSIQSDTGDGLNTLRVSGARDAGGKPLPDDTAHRFVIDSSGDLGANNGLAIGEIKLMRVSWSETDKPADARGYNLHRGLSAAAGTFVKLNDQPLVEPQFTDRGLDAETAYFYKVYLIDADDNATQWTPIFLGVTLPDDGGENRAEDWTMYR